MKKMLLGLGGIMLATTLTAAAAPTINGSTGLINNPSADVLRPGQFAFGYYHVKNGQVGVVGLNLTKNLEIGAAGFRYNNQNNKTNINAKFGLVPEKVLTPGVAIGVEDFGSGNTPSAYAVASKALPFGFRIHLGIGNGRFDGTFACLEKTLNPVSVLTGKNAFPATTLIAEFDGKNMNYGARLSVVPGLKLDAGWRSHAFYTGLSYTY